MKIDELLKNSSSLPIEKKAIISVLHTSSIVNVVINETLKSFDISWQQFNVLRILRGRKGEPATLAEIHEQMISKTSNTTRLIDKLIKKDYVYKSINIKNKRKIDVVITRLGLKLLEETDSIMLQIERDIVHSLTEDESLELIRLLGKIRLIAN